MTCCVGLMWVYPMEADVARQEDVWKLVSTRDRWALGWALVFISWALPAVISGLWVSGRKRSQWPAG